MREKRKSERDDRINYKNMPYVYQVLFDPMQRERIEKCVCVCVWPGHITCQYVSS